MTDEPRYSKIDPEHDLPIPDIDPGHKAVTDEELKRIKDSFPKHKKDLPLATLDVMEHNARHT